MRSFAELSFRARQEAANLVLLVRRPDFSGEVPEKLPVLPDPESIVTALRNSEFAAEVDAFARQIVAHELPLLGCSVRTGSEIRWRRDYRHGKEYADTYFRRIPYLSFDAVGDHKFIWELNRHQHLVLLAKAFLLTGSAEYRDEVFTEVESWLDQNPFQRGINWASALEVGFRALSWIWIYHFLGSEMPNGFRDRFLTGLYRHALHLEYNLSIYFSPNTHLLGEAVALHAIATLFPRFPHAAKWQSEAFKIVMAEFEHQVFPDGAHFEQSSYYHVYALDLFLFFYVVAGRPTELRPGLRRMAEYLWWLLGPSRCMAFTGDDDGGRLFYPYGDRASFGRATLATAGALVKFKDWNGTEHDLQEQAIWWLGPKVLKRASPQPAVPKGSRWFPDTGVVFLQAGDVFVQMDVGAFGDGSGGHSHSDTLSLVVWYKGERVFIDPGTFTYVGDPVERNWFRGSGAHNTVRIDGLDQASPEGPFRWHSKPQVTLTGWRGGEEGGFVDATCSYSGFSHRRRVLLSPGRLLVLDEIGGAGRHTCEQIWQLGPAADQVSLSFSTPPAEVESKFSPAFGAKCPGRSLISTVEGKLPVEIAMLLTTGERQEITIEAAREQLDGA